MNTEAVAEQNDTTATFTNFEDACQQFDINLRNDIANIVHN